MTVIKGVGGFLFALVGAMPTSLQSDPTQQRSIKRSPVNGKASAGTEQSSTNSRSTVICDGRTEEKRSTDYLP